jgi:two-component system response regulator YesN
MELVTEISRFGNNNQLNMEELFGDRGNFMEKALQVESPEELRKWISEVGSRMQEAVQKERQNTTKSFVTKAVEYVQESYSDITISIESVCRKLGVSAAYFSTVFKKETGKTFIGYLTDYRMEQAVELLLTTDDKTYIIAEKVGYADPNYFSYVFKKQYGMAPSKYRTGKLKERG